MANPTTEEVISREKTDKFGTGATRSADAEDVRFDLISPIGLRRLARIYHLGALQHGDMNWEQGLPVHDCVNHMINHLNLYLAGDRSEDHMAKVAWGAFACMHSEEKWPELNKGRLRGLDDLPVAIPKDQMTGGQQAAEEALKRVTFGTWQDPAVGVSQSVKEKIKQDSFVKKVEAPGREDRSPGVIRQDEPK